MSFDIYYHTCNLGTRTEERKNPFTRKVQVVTIDDGISAIERANIEDLLRRSGANNRDGCYALDLPDGGCAEVLCDGLEMTKKIDGCMVAIRSLTPGLVSILWELCQVGNMLAIPVMEPSVTLVSGEQQRQRIQPRWPDAIVVRSAVEFHQALEAGFAAWREYRNQVVK